MAGKLVILKSFNCPSCGAPQQLRAGGFAGTCVCTSCRATIDTSDQKYAVLREGLGGESLFSGRQILPLGKRGTFRDGVFEVVGFMVRSDRTGIYLWNEYLLFNPYKGFRWLMEMNGHWNFVRMVKERPGFPGESSIQYSGMNFKRFLSDEPRVRFVIGEFYWQVKVEDKVVSYDYIAPPFGISCEIEDGEVIWSELEYVTPEQVQQSFKLPSRPSYPRGISPTQPGPCQNTGTYLLIGAVALALLMFIKIVVSSRTHNSLVMPEAQYYYTVGELDKVRHSETFEIPAYGNLKVVATSPVDNNWIDVDVDLINAETQESMDRSLEVSYYHGYDSDGSWSEGSTQSSELFGAVPPGRYYLAFEASADPAVQTQSYTVQARYDVPYQGNFVAAFLAIVIGPILMFARKALFESQRWQESDQGGEE